MRSGTQIYFHTSSVRKVRRVSEDIDHALAELIHLVRIRCAFHGARRHVTRRQVARSSRE